MKIKKKMMIIIIINFKNMKICTMYKNFKKINFYFKKIKYLQ